MPPECSPPSLLDVYFLLHPRLHVSRAALLLGPSIIITILIIINIQLVIIIIIIAIIT